MNRIYATIIIIFLTSTIFANASTTNSKNSELIILVKKQLSLAKKVSKDYVNFQADLKNSKKRKRMTTSIQRFNTNHLKLLRSKNNTKPIKKHINEVGRIWKIAHGLSKNKKHSRMLTSTMNDIHKELQKIRNLYKRI